MDTILAFLDGTFQTPSQTQRETMPNKIKIVTLDENGENEEIVDLEFGETEWEVLEDFARYAAELEAEATWIQEGMPASFRQTWTEKEGIKAEVELPSRDKLSGFLELMRPFVLIDEPTSFYKVANIVGKAGVNRRVRNSLATLRDLYSGRRLQSLFVTAAASPEYPEGRILNSEAMLLLWLNAFRWHKDKDKQKIFKDMHAIAPLEVTMAEFMFLLSDMVRAIVGLRRIISLLKGDEEKIFVPIIARPPLHYLAFLHPTLCAAFPHEFEGEALPSLPREGDPYVRVIDLTERGPMDWLQLVDTVGRLWMTQTLLANPGDRYYYFRVAKGFRQFSGTPYKGEADIIIHLKVQALLMEEPLSEARRKPAEAVLKMIKRQGEQRKSAKMSMKAFDTMEEVALFLKGGEDQESTVDWIIVPRVAYEFAYWPVSRQAGERARQIISDGRKPTFEEIEGSVSKAWEIFDNDEL
jgi:hypothetical protein